MTAGRSHVPLGLGAILLTVGLARLDDGFTGYGDLLLLENIPALLLYTALFYLVGWLVLRFVRRARPRDEA